MSRVCRDAGAVTSAVLVVLLIGGCASAQTPMKLSAATATPAASATIGTPSPSATPGSAGACPTSGVLGAVCGVRFVAKAADGGTDPAAVTGSPVTVQFMTLNAKPTLVLESHGVVINAPVTATQAGLQVDLSSAITSDNLVVAANQHDALAWMHSLLAAPVTLRLSPSNQQLVLTSGPQSVTFDAE